MESHKICYIRVSSYDQNISHQLEGIDLDKVFIDKASSKDRRYLQTYSKRLSILSEEERMAMYAAPDFTKEQRKEYFTFTKDEMTFIFSRTNISAQIYCALQIGYFKAKINFICNISRKDHS